MSFYSQLQQSHVSKVEKKISKLVLVLSQAQYDFTAIVAQLRKDDISQDGVRKYFKRRIQDTHSEVQTLIKIQQKIGGTIDFSDLRTPTKVEFESILEVLHDALAKDKLINKILLELHSRVQQTERPIGDTIQEIEEMIQEHEKHIEQILEQILHLEQNQGQVGEFVISKLLKEEDLRIKKVKVEQYYWKYQSQSSKKYQEKQLSFTKRRILIAKRPSEKHRQLEQLLEKSIGKDFLKQQKASKSDFSRQFKTRKSLE